MTTMMSFEDLDETTAYELGFNDAGTRQSQEKRYDGFSKGHEDGFIDGNVDRAESTDPFYGYDLPSDPVARNLAPISPSLITNEGILYTLGYLEGYEIGYWDGFDGWSDRATKYQACADSYRRGHQDGEADNEAALLLDQISPAENLTLDSEHDSEENDDGSNEHDEMKEENIENEEEALADYETSYDAGYEAAADGYDYDDEGYDEEGYAKGYEQGESDSYTEEQPSVVVGHEEGTYPDDFPDSSGVVETDSWGNPINTAPFGHEPHVRVDGHDRRVIGETQGFGNTKTWTDDGWGHDVRVIDEARPNILDYLSPSGPEVREREPDLWEKRP